MTSKTSSPLIVAVVGVVAIIVCYKVSSFRVHQEYAAASAPPQAPYQTTAVDLYHAYEANEVATDRAIDGRPVEMSGVVQSIDKNYSDQIIISLATDNDYQPAKADLDKSQEAAAAALSKGQAISALCQKMRRFADIPWGHDCVIKIP